MLRILWLSARRRFRQAEADLRHARNACEAKDYNWSAFASHQAAEKAIKAVFQRLHQEGWGHVLSALLGELSGKAKPDAELIDRAKQLDKHYIRTCYPNGFERGAPVDFFDTYTPGSDLDVFIILTTAQERPRDRVTAFLPGRFPVPMDIFPFTRAEMAELESSPLVAAVKKSNWRYKK